MATDCMVCEEWCPTSPKAVYLRPAEVIDAEGNVKQVKQPYLDPSKCVWAAALVNTPALCKTVQRFMSRASEKAARAAIRSC